jgi:hypothetical protein
MFGLSSRSSSARRVRPSVEALESRDVPAAPQITVSHEMLQQNMVKLTGTVTDEHPGLVHIQISGAMNGLTWGTTQGTFEFIAPASYLGDVTIMATDVEGLLSNIATRTLTSNAPVITEFTATAGAGGFWTFSGKVTDESRLGLTVRFGGIPALNGKTAMVNEDGEFSITVKLGPNDTGTATAQTTDWWGLNSNLATWTL